MRCTIATIMILAGWASASMAIPAEGADAGSGGASSVAQYHLGDADDNDGASKPSTSKASTKSAAYTEEQTTEPVSPAAFEINAGGDGMSCSQGCCNSSCNTCCCDNWCNSVRFEYLMWFTPGRSSPPLVTTSPDGTPQLLAGVLDPGGVESATTQILYPTDPIGTDIRNGARITFSHLLSDECTWIDLRAWGVEDSSETFFQASQGSPILAVPFFDALLGVESAQLVAFPGVSSNGSIRVASNNDLFGGDLLLRKTWRQGCHSHIDVLGGYMFSRMDDSLFLNAIYTSEQVPTIGTVNDIQDVFRTQNEFHGASVGFLAATRRNCVSLEILGKIALGNMRQQVAISGTTSATPAGGGTQTVDGGIFTQPSNIGVYSRDQFAVVPELNVNVAYQVNCNWKVLMGYSFIYYSDAVLAGDQIDRRVNLAQLTTPPALPEFNFNNSDFWAMGLSFGAQYEW